MEGFKQEIYENGYFRQEELGFWDCDCNQRMRIASMLSKAAAFAGYDYDARGLTHDKLWEQRVVFLLSRIAVRIHHCPHYGQVLNIHTWENGVKGAHMQRVFSFRDQENEERVCIRSEWIMVDPETRKIQRPSTFTARPIQSSDRPLDCPDPKKIVLPKEGLEDLGTHTVVWSDLDGNGHLFSGNYGDVIWDNLPADLQSKLPTEFYLNYSKEATLGQELILKGFREDNRYSVEGIGPGGTCFTALIVF